MLYEFIQNMDSQCFMILYGTLIFIVLWFYTNHGKSILSIIIGMYIFMFLHILQNIAKPFPNRLIFHILTIIMKRSICVFWYILSKHGKTISHKIDNRYFNNNYENVYFVFWYILSKHGKTISQKIDIRYFSNNYENVYFHILIYFVKT